MARRPRRSGAAPRLPAGGPTSTNSTNWTAGWFALTMFAGGALLLVIPPMFAKMAVPLLGGSAAVGNTILIFFLTTLLVGHVFAQVAASWLGPRGQVACHLVALCLSWSCLPIAVARGWLPSPGAFPVPAVVMLLVVSVGLPFLVVSTSAPLLQAWFRRAPHASIRDPSVLIAAGSFGGLSAVLAYPLCIEPWLTLREQSQGWAAGYGLFAVLIAGCAVIAWRSAPDRPAARLTGRAPSQPVLTAEPDPPIRRLRWLVLSLVSAGLATSVTTYLSTDSGAMPLMRILPLAVYLLTIALAFWRRTARPLMAWIELILPFVLVLAAAGFAWKGVVPAELSLLVLFVVGMTCHYQLAEDLPAAERCTEFSLWWCLGGVLGTMLVAIVPPLVFPGAWEYPLMLAAACLVRPRPPTSSPAPRAAVLTAAVLAVCGAVVWLLRNEAGPLDIGHADDLLVKLVLIATAAAAALWWQRRTVPFAAALVALVLLAMWYPQEKTRVIYAGRSFLGTVRVTGDLLWNAHELVCGSTVRAAQGLADRFRREPWAYYSRSGPLGRIFAALESRRPLTEIGVLGLGAGAVAAYGLPGERMTFYEIDPLVARVARDADCFTYLADSQATVEVVVGDPRLSLAQGPPRRFDLLVIDVFGSDPVPMHLFTREAFQLYLERLADHGVVAIHAPSRHLDIGRVLGGVAAECGLIAATCGLIAAEWIGPSDPVGTGPEHMASTWIVMARRPEDLGSIIGNPAWDPLPPDRRSVWTDDHSSLLGVLNWQSSGKPPLSWWLSGIEKSNHQNLVGIALVEQGRLDEALERFEKAVAFRPANGEAGFNLAQVLAAQGRIDEAIDRYRQTIAVDPDNGGAHFSLALLLDKQGRGDEAIEEYLQALREEPRSAPANLNVAVLLAARGRYREASAHYRVAIEASPDDPRPRNNLAWILATCPDASIRDGAGAVELLRVVEQPSTKAAPEVYDTLAAAYAEAGRFDEAVAMARRARDLATERKQPALADSIGVRLRLSETQSPYREPPVGQAPPAAAP